MQIRERMKGREVISHLGIIPKVIPELFLDHHTDFRNPRSA